MECNVPTDIVFSFSGLALRGGAKGPHSDGWGLALYDGKAVRTFLEPTACAHSPLATYVRQNPIKTLHASLQRDFDHLAIPFRAVATDMSTGRMIVLHEGDLAQAIRASMSVPAIFAPVEIDGRLLADGGLVRNVPVDVARAMGADVVIAVDLTRWARSRELAEDDLKDADVVIRPETVRTRMLDFSAKRENIAAGARAVEGVGPRVAELVREAARRRAARSAPAA